MFLSPMVFSELIRLILTEGESLRHRFVACQVLCFDVKEIGENFFVNNGLHVRELAAALDHPPRPAQCWQQSIVAACWCA